MSGTWRLSGYIVETLLGAGSSGEVWRARVAASDEPVALKRVRALSAAQAQRAEAEAALLRALDHPNLIRLHAAVPVDGAVVLVLDLADGGSLAQLLATRGRLTPGETITAVAPISAALAYLHDEGVVHGDVSAGNILFASDGSAMLGDVGAARLACDDDVGAVATPIYLDPVVATGGVIGPRSDVFALAAVAVHAVTGEPLWRATSADATVATAARADLSELPGRLSAADVPPAMRSVLLRALSLDPARRGTATDFALDLRHAGTPVAVELDAGRERTPPRLPSGPRHAAAVRPDARTAAGSRSSGVRGIGARGIGARELDAGRPDFERPALLPGGGLAPPTRRVQPRPRPSVPRVRRRKSVRRRIVTGALFAVAVLGAGVLTWTQRSTQRADAQPGAAFARPGSTSSAKPLGAEPSGAEPSSAEPSSAESSSAARGAAPSGHSADWLAELRTLDATRAQAFAVRDPSLLSRVYLPGALLDRDRARLTATVPRGCALTGALTRFTSARVAEGELRGETEPTPDGAGATTPDGDAGSATVEVTAALPRTRLTCPGAPTRYAPAVGPVRLQIRLRATPSGTRIIAEALLS